MKKISWFYGLIGLLLLIVIGLLIYNTYLLQNKNTNVDNTSNNNIEIKEENNGEDTETDLSTTDEVVTALMAPFLIVNNYFQNNYFGYFYDHKNIDVNTLPDDIKIMIAINTLNEEWDLKYGIEDTISLTAEQVDQAMKKLFGNIKYNHTSLNGKGCAYNNFIYNESTQTYTQKGLGCGGTLVPFYEANIISAKKYKDRIEITEVVGYFEFNTTDSSSNPTPNLYNNKKEKIKIASNVGSENGLATYKDQLYKYTFTFKLEDGEYHFNKIERNK